MITKRDLLRTGACGLIAAPALKIGNAFAQASAPGFIKAAEIAEQGFIFGLPLVMNYGVMNDFIINKTSGQWKAPFNTIANEARVFTYKDTSVPTPNSDTPYSLLWVDLGAEPMVVSVPAIDPKRYYSVQLIDGNTYIYGYIGSRATGNDAGDFLVAGPDWKGTAPAGIKKVFTSGSRYSLLIFRTQLFDPTDMPNDVKVQSGYKAQPLSAYLKQPAPAALPAVTFPKFSKELAKTNFFDFLDFALQFSPSQPNETDIRAKLAQIGVGPGKTFNFRDLSIKDKAEVLLGMVSGQKKVDEAAKAIGNNVNGWSVGAAFGDSAFYNGNWLLRAAGAKAGIYGNAAEEAMYPGAHNDGAGQVLDGSKANYTLTFAAGQLPPVNAFWSVTMYDGKTQFLIKNPINRYLINSPMLPGLKKNADGSVTLYIQNKSPGADKESNWLPAPNGPIYVVMRLYWPKKEPPSILPAGTGTWQPPAIQKA